MENPLLPSKYTLVKYRLLAAHVFFAPERQKVLDEWLSPVTSEAGRKKASKSYNLAVAKYAIAKYMVTLTVEEQNRFILDWGKIV